MCEMMIFKNKPKQQKMKLLPMYKITVSMYLFLSQFTTPTTSCKFQNV